MLPIIRKPSLLCSGAFMGNDSNGSPCTVATVIASQALITGVYSITQQAMQLGYLPRLTVTHTSASHIGQIYVPAANWALMVALSVLCWDLALPAGLRRPMAQA